MVRLKAMLRGFSRLREFMRNRDGAVALQVAIVAVPMATVIFGVVDLSRASAIKAELQDALDAAALSAARSNASTNTALQSIGSSALTANFAVSGATVATSDFHGDEDKVIASAQATFSPLFPSQWLTGDMEVSAQTEVSRSVNTIELALVLDNTGSMAGTRLATLKTASNKLIDTLSSAAARSPEPNAVHIGLVPFSMTVNVGAANKNASWMDTTGISPINDQIFSSHANRYTLLTQMDVAWGGCVEARQHPYDVQDTTPDAATPATLFTPYFAPDEPSNSTSAINNYIADGMSSGTWMTRQGSVAKYTVAPRSGDNPVGYTYGPNAGCELQPIMPLTTDFAALKTAVTNMAAVGDTNVGMGLVWGWHLLSPGEPFTQGLPYNTDKNQKIVILMTDGDNTYGSSSNTNDSIYNGLGYIWQGRLGITSGTTNQRRTAMDNRLATICTNMKAQGIILYTVRVEVTNSTSTVLRDCATTPDKFYDVSQVSQLDAVFDAIAAAIQNLRLIH